MVEYPKGLANKDMQQGRPNSKPMSRQELGIGLPQEAGKEKVQGGLTGGNNDIYIYIYVYRNAYIYIHMYSRTTARIRE